MRLLVIILTGLLLLLQVRLWTGEGSFTDVWRIEDAVDAQRAENAQMQARNAALAAEVADLKKGTAAIEERARSELGMIKEGETFFQVIVPTSEQSFSPRRTSFDGD